MGAGAGGEGWARGKNIWVIIVMTSPHYSTLSCNLHYPPPAPPIPTPKFLQQSYSLLYHQFPEISCPSSTDTYNLWRVKFLLLNSCVVILPHRLLSKTKNNPKRVLYPLSLWNQARHISLLKKPYWLRFVTPDVYIQSRAKTTLLFTGCMKKAKMPTPSLQWPLFFSSDKRYLD